MITMIALLIGISIFCAGIYYLIKEKADSESRMIYTITAVIGVVIVIGAIVKILVFGM